MRLLGDSRAVLDLLHQGRPAATVAYVSRTTYPQWAVPLLSLMRVREGVSMADVCDSALNQIYPGNKQTHFRRIAEASGVALDDMLFFDNEMRNVRDVADLGVTCVHTPDGLTMALWERGLAEFAQAHPPPSAARGGGSSGASGGGGGGDGGVRRTQGKKRQREADPMAAAFSIVETITVDDFASAPAEGGPSPG